MSEQNTEAYISDLFMVLAHRKALGLSDRIPCLTPYIAPLPDERQQGPSKPE